MIYIERAGAEDLETIITSQRASLRPFMRNIWLSGPIVFIILSKTTRRFWALFA